MILIKTSRPTLETAAYHMTHELMEDLGVRIGTAGSRKIALTELKTPLLMVSERDGDEINVLIELVPIKRGQTNLGVNKVRIGKYPHYKVDVDVGSNEWIGIYLRLMKKLRRSIDDSYQGKESNDR